MDNEEGKDKAQFLTDWENTLVTKVMEYGGWVNAHTHLDRADTTSEKYLHHVSMDPVEASSYPLSVKQDLTGDLHRGEAYQQEDLENRMRTQLEKIIKLGTREVVAFIDTTADNVKLSALETALKLKNEFVGRINILLGAHPIFGFRDGDTERWKIYEQAAEKVDILGALPERDIAKNHIGYDEHMKRILELGKKLKKPVHMHVDQTNSPYENGTETLVQAVRWIGSPEIQSHEPSVWAIHAIAPSCYSEERFEKLLKALNYYKIGVICCPSAAISMRQPRQIKTPTHSSIARVLEMLMENIPIKLGSDNIGDVFIPSGTTNLYFETVLLSHAVRFYNPSILAKISAAKPLNNMDRELIKRFLDEDKKNWQIIEKQWQETEQANHFFYTR